MLIDIAVPTYNCATWLDTFLESIVSQDSQDWRILTRDDGSTDATLATIAAWKTRLGDRLVILADGEGNLGPVGNYDAVLRLSRAPIIMLADPDDLWLPGK